MWVCNASKHMYNQKVTDNPINYITGCWCLPCILMKNFEQPQAVTVTGQKTMLIPFKKQSPGEYTPHIVPYL